MMTDEAELHQKHRGGHHKCFVGKEERELLDWITAQNNEVCTHVPCATIKVQQSNQLLALFHSLFVHKDKIYGVANYNVFGLDQKEPNSKFVKIPASVFLNQMEGLSEDNFESSKRAAVPSIYALYNSENKEAFLNSQKILE